MPWKKDANGVLHWTDDPNADFSGMTMATSGRSADDRWEDPENSDEGGGDEKKKKDEGDDNGDGGDDGGGDNGDGGGGNDSGDNGDGGGDNGDGGGGGNDTPDDGSNNFGVEQSQQSRDNWFQTQEQDFQNQQDAFNSGWNNDFSGRMQDNVSRAEQPFDSSIADSVGNHMDDIHQAYQWYQENGIGLTGNNNVASTPTPAPQFQSPQEINPYQYSPAQTPTTTNGSVFATIPTEQPQLTAPAANTYQPFDVETPEGRHAINVAGTNTLVPPKDEASVAPAPEATTTTLAPGAEPVANAAAQATANAGGSPEEVAQAAVLATRMLALDNQTLDQQSSWTRQMFKSTYGPNADQEWVRQHNAELQRNKALYGTEEPTTGTAPVTGAPAGTPVAPNRTIGAVAPPAAGETGRYGINTPVVPQPSPTRPASDAAPVAPPPAAPQPGVAPNARFQTEPQVPVQPGMNPEDRVPPGSQAVPTYISPTSFRPAPLDNVPMPQGVGTPPAINPQTGEPTGLSPLPNGPSLPAINPQTGEPTGLMPNQAPNTAVRGAPITETQETADSFPGKYSVPGAMVDPERPGVDFLPDGTARDEKSGRILGTYDTNNPPPGLVPAGSDYSLTPATQDMRTAGFDVRSAVGRTGLEAQPTSVPTNPVPGMQSGGALPGDVVPVGDRVQTALNSARPLDTLAELAAKPGVDTRADAINITNGIGAMLRGDSAGAWAEPYLNDVARLAWAREERGNGRVSDPRDTPDSYIEHWKDAFFGSDHNVPMVKELDQQMIDYAVDRTPPGKSFDWKQAFGPTGENGLISRQVASNDCGPNAFATILRSRGYNADGTQTFAYAKQYGYHNGSEFTGPENMARMLRQEAGLDAKASPVDWGTVDSELDAGRPVVLSSPGHYWVVASRRDGPQGSQYYAGETAGVVSNPQWSSRGQLRYGGAPDTMIVAKGDVDPNARAVRQMSLPAPVLTQGGRREDLSPSERMNLQVRASMSSQTQKSAEEPTDSASPQTLGAGAVGGPPSDQANLRPTFTVDDTVNMRDRILHEAPQIQLTPDMDIDARMQAIAPTMEWVQKEYGVPADVMAGMMYNESHVGAADSPASRANNLLSIQYMPSDSQATGPAPGQTRWAGYPSVNANVARFLGMYAHPENGHQRFWANRSTPDSFIQGLKNEHYVVDEPGAGNSIREWEAGVRKGMDLYHRAVGR